MNYDLHHIFPKPLNFIRSLSILPRLCKLQEQFQIKMDATSIRVPYRNLKQEVELVGADEWERRHSPQIQNTSPPPELSGGGDSPPSSDRHHALQENCSLLTLILSCTVAAGVQFGWALQLSLLTPYIQVRCSDLDI